MGKPSWINIQLSYSEYIAVWGETQGTETSKYLEEKKEKSIPLVAASEKGLAQTIFGWGCRTVICDELIDSRMVWEGQSKSVRTT